MLASGMQALADLIMRVSYSSWDSQHRLTPAQARTRTDTSTGRKKQDGTRHWMGTGCTVPRALQARVHVRQLQAQALKDQVQGTAGVGKCRQAQGVYGNCRLDCSRLSARGS